jgi:hypothetical protein
VLADIGQREHLGEVWAHKQNGSKSEG